MKISALAMMFLFIPSELLMGQTCNFSVIGGNPQQCSNAYQGFSSPSGGGLI